MDNEHHLNLPFDPCRPCRLWFPGIPFGMGIFPPITRTVSYCKWEQHTCNYANYANMHIQFDLYIMHIIHIINVQQYTQTQTYYFFQYGTDMFVFIYISKQCSSIRAHTLTLLWLNLPKGEYIWGGCLGVVVFQVWGMHRRSS